MFDFLGALAKTLCIQEKLFFVQMKYKDCRRHGLLDFFNIGFITIISMDLLGDSRILFYN